MLDYNFTAYVEKEFDDIAEGKMKWQEMIADFYKPFHKDVVLTEKTAERASGERILGIDPKTGKTVSARIGKFGPMVQMKMDENDEKPQFASLRTGQRLETITFEEAMDLFKLPRNLGLFEEKEIVVSIGRFGPYVRHNNIFCSIPKTDDPYTITPERAIELILAKRQADSERIIKTFDENPEIRVLKGRWGPYISFGKRNIKIPKGKEPESITYEEILKLSEEPEGKRFKSKVPAEENTSSKKPVSKKSVNKKANPKGKKK